MSENYLELVRLQACIKEGLESLFPDKVWVKAEISQYSPKPNGHCYLSLSQSRNGRILAESKAMIWEWRFPALAAFFEKTTGEPLRAGITVLVRCQVNFSELYGISLFIDDIDPAFTMGEKALEKKRTVERLGAEGYMDMQKEFSLPRLPYRLAVISSPSAAGYGDFCRHLLENPAGYKFSLTLFEAVMQGEEAPSSIADALARVTEDGGYDAALILRGGGSETDLACFDDYFLAVAIATSPFPVITAIGHDRDFHVADMVAWKYVKTPTALADLFLKIYSDEDENITSLGARIRHALSAVLAERVRALDAIPPRISRALGGRYFALEKLTSDAVLRLDRALRDKLRQPEKELDAAVARILFAARSRHGAAVSEIALKEALIKASDPRTLLGKGFVLVTGKDNRLLKTVDKVSVGDRIGVRFLDGTLTARVDKVISDAERKTKTNIA